MATIVFIPGGWHGGWWFAPIVERLRAEGHRAHAVTLTGVGERLHLTGRNGATNLDTHIEDVVAFLEAERLDDVVLCGHSYGGMVATGVADRMPERIASLVYLDAQVPRDGESLWTLTTPTFREAFFSGARDGANIDPPPGLDPRVTTHPLACFMQPISLTGAWTRVPDKRYVWCSEWKDSPFRTMYERVLDEPGWDVRAWPIEHDIVGQAPDDLVALLDDAAQATAHSS